MPISRYTMLLFKLKFKWTVASASKPSFLQPSSITQFRAHFLKTYVDLPLQSQTFKTVDFLSLSNQNFCLLEH